MYTIGTLVPSEFSATVAGRHEGIVNLLLSDHAGPYLVSLLRDSRHWTELGVLLGADQWHRLSTLTAGAVVMRDPDGKIQLPHSRTVLSSFHRHRSVPRRGADLPRPDRATLKRCRTALLERYSDIGFVSLLARGKAPNDGDAFVRRARTRLAAAPDAGPKSLSAIIGLGPGMTPAGDDFISGVLLAQSIIHRAGLSERDGKTVLGALNRTTPAGASLLRLATADLPPAYQCAIVEALAVGDCDAAVDRAREHGASSGLDALSGLLWAMI